MVSLTYFDPEGERRNSMKKVFFLVLLFSVVVFSPVQAEDKKADDAIVTMEEIVVTATKIPENEKTFPMLLS